MSVVAESPAAADAAVAQPMAADDLEQLEIRLLFEALRELYGQDFRQYSYDSARRRVLQRMRAEGLASISQLLDRVIRDRVAADALLAALSINVTEMFRDPGFFQALREQVFPLLQECEHIRIWHAGCSSGEEVYSMAVLLHEAGLYDRSMLYATDFNHRVLARARAGIYPLSGMRAYVRNYQLAGGQAEFADYYRAGYDGAVMDGRLKRRIRFAYHNLVTDGGFAEVQLVVCRNVLIYFDPQLQQRVIGLFRDSLITPGILCLGGNESLQRSGQQDVFTAICEPQKIYQVAQW